jgi:DMSO/TMAO reductase YedYZ molybdopterin-dependent catalytic subunit/thiosulfate reductase cytochrome b subunit
LTADGPDPFREFLRARDDPGHRSAPIVIDDWAGGIAQTRAKFPALRLGRRWFSSLWLLPLGIVALVLSIALVREVMHHPWYEDFITRYPGTSTDYVEPLDTGLPWWLRWQHFFNLLFMMFIIRAGLQILADHPRLYFNAGSRPDSEWLRLRDEVPVDRRDSGNPESVWTAKEDSVALPKHLGIPGFRHSIGLARWWHFSFNLLWVVNGAIFYVLLFSTGEWKRLVPNSFEVFPNALSTALQYLSLELPANEGFSAYNALQLLAYFITVFVAAPVAMVTGLLQAPSIAGRFGTGAGVLNRQVARSIHFGVLIWMLVFIVLHTAMVFVTGFVRNVNHITLGVDSNSLTGVWLYLAWMAVVVAFWLVASPVTISHPRAVQRTGRFMVGWLKGLLEGINPTATYTESDISPYLWTNGERPVSAEYRRLRDAGWAGYALRVDGLVAKPQRFAYGQLQAMPRQEQITQHFCIQGWSGIAKWAGVPMRAICDEVQPALNARWVVFYSFSEGPVGGRYYDCHPIGSMYHDLTILAYEMNGEPLSESHGAPLRLRNEVELGFKQVKWIEAIEFVESFEHLGAGQGGYNEDQEFYGYRMPI